jgi:NAD(P)H-flavin reductase
MDKAPLFTGQDLSNHHQDRCLSATGMDSSYSAEITMVAQLAPAVRLYRMTLHNEWGRDSFRFTPGQFVLLEVPGIGEAPFTLASTPVQHGEIELCIREVGTLTAFLARIGSGTQVRISGPFGRGFPMTMLEGGDLFFIAGGLGLVPLRSALLAVRGHRNRFGRVVLCYGSKEPKGLLFKNEYTDWELADIRVVCTVDQPDDDWSGSTGTVNALLPGLANLTDVSHTARYALVCGPPVMFTSVCDWLLSQGFPPQRIFVTLERRMHCGSGKCCRCNIGSTYTCLDGPVFDYWSVMNLKEAI